MVFLSFTLIVLQTCSMDPEPAVTMNLLTKHFLFVCSFFCCCCFVVVVLLFFFCCCFFCSAAVAR